ncbi:MULTISPECIES: ATP-dependent DNA helicase RecG [Anaerococcus]|uniref:ATP-dependent DNA helicase RecG n=1 Tax=Anaerococcus octavius TaxID=54007 RepID=A0A2I1M9K8_9FIRM|nr:MULTISPECIES: ATP-dependent DNA helicase RecG [Anaerococcus]MBS6105845.1 ATP-dependent DNA helicase RecG [Anaerococcus sp.]MDU2598173.1 ATP-dependent DNA helicase RecG [Anaerococcus sp.]MDU3177028.1 ATP-dependent DNA helicase RecG [Anaerococcus sp.]MDU7411561.1 ATP-dependent DNA helicase RecG [Anaerococcus sp.]PKZ16811.1 ATP-dependent DNA helicase RecG [Anaerococcus octavius]
MDLLDLKGIGPKKKDTLRKLNIYTVADLYNYYPTSFEDRTNKLSVVDANPHMKYYFIWKITSTSNQIRTKRGIISYLFALEEKSGQKIKIIWFNDRFSQQRLKIYESYKFFTKVSYENGIYQAVNPIFCDLDDQEIGNIIAIYPLTSGINQKQLSKFIFEALKNFDSDEEIFDKRILEKISFKSKYENLNEIHFPSDKDRLMQAKSQTKISDFVKELIYIDYINKQLQATQELNLIYDLDIILDHLDFKLTRSQLISLKEILADANKKVLMNRLLIGDVGSGKTIVAILAMIVFAKNGYQAAMMVPTEVLAIQQYEKNLSLIEGFDLKFALLTGSSKNKDAIKAKLNNGEIDIVIGTHALIQEDVSFKDLRFVVNDEQHRFGVGQRQALGQKGTKVNYLTMTATPIPRTISIRISKILDLSMINELPKGRKPITTKIVSEVMEKALFDQINHNLQAGRQVYVVSNNIDADDKNSVENLYKRYKKIFKSKNVKKLHGNMKAKEKDKTLKDFADGKIDILISTTVIEVGIDVANANTMVIYNANHFGLSSLHQLRGRVGRGVYDSFCYLVSKNVDNNSKLNILVNNENGFDIAKKDFDLRGGGKILSAIQHGRNISKIEFLNMSKEEIEKSFEIFDYLKANNFDGVNFTYIEKFFEIDRRIILN